MANLLMEYTNKKYILLKINDKINMVLINLY